MPFDLFIGAEWMIWCCIISLRYVKIRLSWYVWHMNRKKNYVKSRTVIHHEIELKESIRGCRRGRFTTNSSLSTLSEVPKMFVSGSPSHPPETSHQYSKSKWKNENFCLICTLRSVTMSGHVKYKRNSLACKMQEDSACNTGDSAGNTHLPLSLILATAYLTGQ